MNISGLCILILLPVAVYAVALSSAFMSSGKMLLPALFALGSLLSAELVWQGIRYKNGFLKQKQGAKTD